MRNQHVSILEWVIIFIVLTIPFINIIMIIVLAVGNFNTSLKNFAKALIFAILIGVLLLTYFYGSFGNFLRHMPRI